MRKIWDIHGGIHPAENKAQSLRSAIRSAGIPQQLILPLAQHIGAPAKAIVAPGDRVLGGQCIAEATGFVSAPVHAPTSGTVVAIEDHPIPHPSGMSGRCIIIDTDGADEHIAYQGVSNYRALDKSELLNIIRQAGIAGMGGAGFPSAVKLGPKQPIETLIINGTECEPYITADDILMRERAEDVIAGVKILQHLVSPSKETLIGVEDNKPEAIAALNKAAEGSDIEVVVFPTKYPSGGEKQLIQILTGKEVKSGGLPAEVGIVCQNIGTTTAIYHAVTQGKPLTSRITTVTGEACAEPQNYEVMLGTPVSHLLALAGFEAKKLSRLVMGGPMMGYTLHSDAIPVVKTSNCVLAPSRKELPPPQPAQACIRCGMCAEACPVSLLPQQMYWFSRAQEHQKLEEHNLFDCIECGACSYSCPSHIPLVQYYRASKAEIRQAQQDKIKAEHAKERFEARQARQEAEAAEKEAKRQARQAAAKAKAAQAAEAAANGENGDAKDDVIAAAVARAAAKKAEADPAKAAIERAMAKRAGGAEDESPEAKTERLEKAVASAEKRLAASREKLKIAQDEGADTAAAFATAVEKTEAKLSAAKAELEQHQASLGSAKDAQTETTSADPADPAQAVIARAMAAREASADMSEEDKLKKQVDSLQARITKTETKLQAAQEAGADTVDVIAGSLDKLKDKLQRAEQDLAASTADQAATETASTEIASETDSDLANNDDPAQAAIARAMAARDAAANMSKAEKLQQNVDKLEQRLAKTKDKLAAAKAAGDDNADIIAGSLDKLEAKLNEARAALAEEQA